MFLRMKAARVHHKGGPEVLVLEDAPEPKPARGEVLIKVESASVNFSDVVRRRGDPYPYPTPSPFVPGAEIAGTVAGHGEGVSGPPLGTPVFALLGNVNAGGYAQYAVAPFDQVVVLPPPLDADPDRACTLVVAGVTALQTLVECGRMAAGDSVWIPAAAGGVGSYAVQIARALGAGKIIAGVGDLEKADFVRSLGAHEVVSYADAGWTERVRALTGGRGVDVALEMTGGAMFEQTLSILGAFGRLVVYGTASGEIANLQAPRLLPQNQSVTGYYVSGWFAKRPRAALRALERLIELVRDGTVDVRIGNVLPLAEAAEAHRLLERRSSVGKIVLKPWQLQP
jgi:NADPH2:quinone reductase